MNREDMLRLGAQRVNSARAGDLPNHPDVLNAYMIAARKKLVSEDADNIISEGEQKMDEFDAYHTSHSLGWKSDSVARKNGMLTLLFPLAAAYKKKLAEVVDEVTELKARVSAASDTADDFIQQLEDEERERAADKKRYEDRILALRSKAIARRHQINVLRAVLLLSFFLHAYMMWFGVSRSVSHLSTFHRFVRGWAVHSCHAILEKLMFSGVMEKCVVSASSGRIAYVFMKMACFFQRACLAILSVATWYVLLNLVALSKFPKWLKRSIASL